MEETIEDKAIVTIEIPKRLRVEGGTKYAQWREYKFKTRLMPNGYRVTLAAVMTDNYLYFGASACAPDDCFDEKSAHPRALGRARQTALLITNGHPVVGRYTLLSNDRSEVGGVFYLNVQDSIETKRSEMYRVVGPLYDIAASNAETRGVLKEVAYILQRHGGRFLINVHRSGK